MSYADRVCGAVVLGGLLECIVFRSSPPLVRSSGFCSAKLYLQCPCHRRLLSCVRCFKAFQRKDLKQLEDGLVQFVVAGLLDLRAGAAGEIDGRATIPVGCKATASSAPVMMGRGIKKLSQNQPPRQ